MFFEMRRCQVRLVDDQKICFFKTTFDLGTLDSGERSLPFGLLVLTLHDLSNVMISLLCALQVAKDPKLLYAE